MVFSRARKTRSLAQLAAVWAGLSLLQGNAVAKAEDDLTDLTESNEGSGFGSSSGSSSWDGSFDGYGAYGETPGSSSALLTGASADPSIDAATGCPFKVSLGDYNVGIHLVGDASCVKGGVGCFQNVCRYCQYKTTPQSGHLMTCKSLGYAFGTATPTATTAPVLAPNPETGCPYSVSSGDFAVGVQLVGDAACAKGGLGCFKDVCRYCKFKETPQSSHWLSCSTYGYPRTQAPLINTVSLDDYNCPYTVSGGDFAVGIQLVGDAACAKGGVGCYQKVCRYCKFKESSQSSHMLKCSDLGYSISGGTAAAVGNTVSLDDGPDTGCPYGVSTGDFAVGIQLVGDSACSKGGLGCFADICRYCKFQETPQSKHLMTCPDAGYPAIGYIGATPATTTAAPPIGKPSDITDDPVDPLTKCVYAASAGDIAAGVQLVGDVSCAAGGGLGCFKEVCRYCKFIETDKSKNWLKCVDLGYTALGYQPASAPAVTSAPAAVDPVTKCAFPISAGDLAVGVQLVGDSSCVSGGVGCFQDTCRYCKFKETEQSKNWLKCTDLGYASIGYTDPNAVITPQDVVDSSTRCAFPASAGDVAAGVQLVGDASCANGGLGCFKDVCRYCKVRETEQSKGWLKCVDLGYPSLGYTPANVVINPSDITDPSVPSTGCPYPVAPGDLAAGVQLVGDASCAAGGGVGCYKDVCRYCQFGYSAQSSVYKLCSELGYTFTAPAATPAPTLAPGSTDCPYPVSDGDFAVGLKLVADATCAGGAGGVGCYKDVCRYCKFMETDQSKTYLPCTGGTADGSTPAPVSLTACTQVVAEGDKNAGINIVLDLSCAASPSVGCVPSSVCRYCKVTDTATSTHMEWCSVVQGGTAPPPVPTVTSAIAAPSGVEQCGQVVSEGDKAAGIMITIESACPVGVGCLPDNTQCRFCKTVENVKASQFNWCPGYPQVTASQIAAPPANVLSAARPMRAATHNKRAPTKKSLQLSTKAAATEDRLDELLKDNAFKWSITAAACVGVVAAVALVALGTKRAVARRRSAAKPDETVEEAAASETEATTKTTLDDTGLSDDETLGEFHV